MAAYMNDDGTQTITFDYQQDATGEDFNVLCRDLFKAGIYVGGLLSRVDDVTVSLASYVAVIYDNSVDSKIAIRVETEDAYNVAIDSVNTVIVLQYDWVNTAANYVKAVAVAPGSVVDTDVVVGIGNFTGAVLSSTFIYDDVNNPREVISKDADTILLGAVSIDSQPTGGTNSQFTGTSTYITTILTDIYARLIDLTGAGNTSVLKRHVDLDITTGIDGNDIKTGLAIAYEGSSPGSITNTTVLAAALQTITNLIKDLSGANDDSVLLRHLNFGTGGTQISLKDFVIGVIGTARTMGSFTDYNFAISDVINTALNNLSGVVHEIATQVDINTAKAGTDLENRLTALEAKTFVNDYPVGAIIMFNGANWNNGSLDGNWRVCDGTNETPDLSNLFIKAVTSNAGVGDGVANISLVEANIPQHNHSFSASLVGGLATSKSIAHVHGMQHTHPINITHTGVGAVTGFDDKNSDGSDGTFPTNVSSINNTEAMSANATHTHPVTGSVSGNTGNYGQASVTPITLNPVHYKLLYIIRIAS